LQYHLEYQLARNSQLFQGEMQKF